MLAIHIVVGTGAVLAALAVLLSVLRSVVLPRGVPTRLTRITFLVVRAALTLRLQITRSRDYETRDRVFALQAPIGVFGQLFMWASLLFLCFAGVFWALGSDTITGAGIARALELAGSSMLTIGTDAPNGLGNQLLGFAAAGVGLVLLALVITYLPSLYNAFSRREALIVKLIVITGSAPNGARLLQRTWELHCFEVLDEVWDQWGDWFVELGESHTSIPQLSFFRSSHPHNHWVLATETVLDGANLVQTACDVDRQFRSELCVEAGVQALTAIVEFFGTRLPAPDKDPEIRLARETFDAGCDALRDAGVPMRSDRDAAWAAFRRGRARYEPLLALLGAITIAPGSDWSSWSEDSPRHTPPVFRIHTPK